MLEDFIKGAAIILKYEPNAQLSAEHDVIYVGTYEITYIAATQEEFEWLVANGFDQEFGTWRFMV